MEVGADEAETLLSYGVVDQLRHEARDRAGSGPDGGRGATIGPFRRFAGRRSGRGARHRGSALGRPVVIGGHTVALRRLRADKVLTVATARVGGMADTGWARFVAGDPRVTRLRLGGLSPVELTELARRAGPRALSPRGASRLVAHTEGNALYCRALLDEIGVDGLSTEAVGLPAPRELSAVILARAAGLSASTQAFLAAASVLGQHAGARGRCGRRPTCCGPGSGRRRRRRPDERRCHARRAGFRPPALPGHGLRRSQPDAAAGAARPGGSSMWSATRVWSTGWRRR